LGIRLFNLLQTVTYTSMERVILIGKGNHDILQKFSIEQPK